MSALNPIKATEALMRSLIQEFPDVMFSPRTSCVPHTERPGWKSADLVLYSHNFTDLEVRIHVLESGQYEITADPDTLSQACRSYSMGFLDGLNDAQAFREKL